MGLFAFFCWSLHAIILSISILYYCYYFLSFLTYNIYLLCCKLAQIGIHYGGKFYEFVPWNGVVSWEVATWGYWFMSADNGNYVVNISLQLHYVLC